MNKFIVFLFIVFYIPANAGNSSYFDYNRTEILNSFAQLTQIENNVLQNTETVNLMNMSVFTNAQTLQLSNTQLAPGSIPSFLFTFVISAIGAYTLYGAGAGPAAVGVVYLVTKGDKHELTMASWGCLAGLAVGGVAKYFVLNTR